MSADHELIEHFVATFGHFDEMRGCEELDPIAKELKAGPSDEFGYFQWHPAKVSTDVSLLEPIYAKLPARFPPLYEQLVLTYRWAAVYLDRFSLLANPLGSDLSGLLEQMSRDSAIWNSLRPAGYVQFGRGPDMDYDPVCFDIRVRQKKGEDYRIVKIDHEEILCNNRVKVVAELAPSFRQLVADTIAHADQA